MPQYLFQIWRDQEFRGTAVLVSKRHLLTCAHVVKSAKKVTIRGEGFEEDADVIGVSPEDQQDLALLRLPKDLHDPQPWAHQVASGKEVCLEGFADVRGEAKKRSVEDRVTPHFDDSRGWVVRLGVNAGVDHGMSGGVAVALIGGSACYVGLIQEGGKRALRSLLAGAAEIAPFVEKHLGQPLPGCPRFGPVVDADPDADIRKRYLKELARRTAQIDIRGFQRSDNKATAFAIDDLYVPLRNREDQEIEESVRKHQCLVVVGDAGSGKSTFLQRMAHELARSGKRFPLLIRVVELDRTIHKKLVEPGTPASPDDPRWIAVHVAADDCGLDEAFVLRQMERAETLVLLDGLDEALSDPGRRSLAKLFDRAAKKFKKCRFVVTTRPGAWVGESRAQEFAQDEIGELSEEARSKFFENWYRCAYPDDAAKAEAGRADLERQANNDEVREMSGNPMMLTALACIHWNEGRLPHDRGELYKSVLEWMARARESRPGRVSAKRCLELLGALAFGMQTGPEGRLKQADRDAAVKILVEQARMGTRAAREFLEQEELDSGIIVSRGAGQVEFRHLTFQEYLAATELMLNRLEDEQRETLLGGRRRFSVEWREFLRLCAIALQERRARWLYGVLLGGAGETLADRARTVALVRLMAWDRREKEEGIEGRYREFVREMAGLFEGKADGMGLDLWSRGQAAEAWEILEGDSSRLRLPADEDYWEPVDGGFEIGRCPVTVHEYGIYLDACPAVERPYRWDEQKRFPLRPVVYVSAFDAETFCRWWSEQTGRVVRLPTEDEWYAAAAGTASPKREYAWGDEEPNADRANYGYELRSVSPVGLFPSGAASGTRIMDMAGNVWEWTSSPWSNDDPARVLRGGSFDNVTRDLRAACRYFNGPDGRDSYIGFRCLREVFP